MRGVFDLGVLELFYRRTIRVSAISKELQAIGWYKTCFVVPCEIHDSPSDCEKQG